MRPAGILARHPCSFISTVDIGQWVEMVRFRLIPSVMVSIGDLLGPCPEAFVWLQPLLRV